MASFIEAFNNLARSSFASGPEGWRIIHVHASNVPKQK
jgi:hypothetical protein